MAQQIIQYFRDEMNRRTETFQNSQYSNIKYSLARNGFIFTKGHLVCVFCFKILKRVDKNSDIVKRHFAISKNCSCYSSCGNNPNIVDGMFEGDKAEYFQMKREFDIKELKKKMKMITEKLLEK